MRWTDCMYFIRFFFFFALFSACTSRICDEKNVHKYIYIQIGKQIKSISYFDFVRFEFFLSKCIQAKAYRGPSTCLLPEAPGHRPPHR